MGEIIQINFGQSGINVGKQYLEKLIRDHDRSNYDSGINVNPYNGSLDKQVKWIADGFLHVDCKVEHPLLGGTIMYIGNQRFFGQTLQPIADKFVARQNFVELKNKE